MKSLTTAFFLTLGLAASLSGAVAQKPPLFWPESRLIPIQVAFTTSTFDGFEFEMVEFKNSALPLYSPSMTQWKQNSGLSHRNASAVFTNRRDPSIKAGVSIVRTQDWLKELSNESLSLYVDSLRNLHKERFTLLEPDNNFAPIQRSGFLVGHPYKLVHYRIKPEEEEKSTIEIWDFVTEHEGYTVVFSFECPEELASRNFNTASTLMTSLCRMDELE